MLIYQNKSIQQGFPVFEQNFIAVLSNKEAHDKKFSQFIPQNQAVNHIEGISHFESHHGIDYMFLHLYMPHEKKSTEKHLQICLTKTCLLFISEQDNLIEKTSLKLHKMMLDAQEISPDYAIAAFFMGLTETFFSPLNKIEAEIGKLEDSIMEKKDGKYIKSIHLKRKELLELKKHHQSLFMLLEDLEENSNNLLSSGALRNISIAKERTNRLYNSIINLRDYITQARESLQTEIDISMNQVMKFFTVVTVIFLPLTLIVGWYGMNLSMPETAWAGMYPLLIVASLTLALFIVAYFKRNKWF